MGLGSSQDYYEPPSIRSSLPSRHGAAGPSVVPGPGRAVRRRRRRIFRRVRQAPTTVIAVPQPVRHHSPHRHHHHHHHHQQQQQQQQQQHHHHRQRQFSPPLPGFAPLATGVPPSLPMSYHNFTALPYIPPQSVLLPAQQMPPIVMPQQMPQSYQMMAAQSRPMTAQRFAPMILPQNLLQQQPVMMPQYMPQQPPMMVPQDLPQSQAMRMPLQMPASVYSPYVSSPYAMGASYSNPYAPQQGNQQQPHVQHIYNNIAASIPGSAGISGPVGPFSSPHRPAGPSLGTDWTGGGKISPGFLGPPL